MSKVPIKMPTAASRGIGQEAVTVCAESPDEVVTSWHRFHRQRRAGSKIEGMLVGDVRLFDKYKRAIMRWRGIQLVSGTRRNWVVFEMIPRSASNGKDVTCESR